jgi:PAS domain S-box-containing protein
MDEHPAPQAPLGDSLPPDVLGAAIARIGDIVMVTEAGASARILFVNPAFEAITGYRADEALGRSPGFLRGPDTSEDEVRRISAAFHARGTFRAEVLNYRKDGAPIWLEIEGSPVRSPSTGAECYVFVERDISGRKKAEAAKREQERAVATLFSNLPGMAYRCRNDDARTVEFVSAGCRELTGFEAGQLVGGEPGGFEKLVEADDRVAVRREVARSVAQGEAFELSYRIRTRAGALKWVWDRGRAVPAAGFAPPVIEGFMTDITERKLLESQVLQNERLESVGTLAGGIAHDLNNVLSPIMMAGDLLADQMKDKEAAQLLQVIAKSAKRGAELVRQILLFARGLEGPKLAVEVESIFGELRAFLESTLPKSIRVSMEIVPGTRAMAGDPVRLHQLLLGLAVNARDAMPDGGTLVVTAAPAFIPASGPRPHPDAVPGDFVRIDVADTGCGIPETVRGQIFNPFFTTKGVGKGSGLGLSTARSIAKSHAGFITLVSAVGVGTTFSVFIPTADSGLARPVRGDPAGEAKGPPARGSGQLVLVVDDEQSVRVIMHSTLEGYGYRVALAPDGLEALKILEGGGAPIAAALVDIHMPGIGGTMTIGALRSRRPELPIVGTSGYATADERAEAARNGAAYFLEKPFSVETLLHTVAAAIGSSVR